MNPVKISNAGGALSIKWDDNSEDLIKLTNLRFMCPCALCAEKRANSGTGYVPLYSDKELALTKIDLIGKYAIKVTWGDGHDTGIYDFVSLKKLIDELKV